MVTLFLMLDFLQPPCAAVGGGREEGPPAGRLPGGPSAGGPSAAEPLQAQLTLQRLKLAHGGSAAAASSVLNQLLSNANMFNQLQTPSIVGNPPGAFPTAVMGFPSSNAAVRPSVSVGLNQSSANVRLNPISGEYGKPPGSVFSCDSDRRFQFGSAAASSAASVSAGDQQFSGITTQAQNTGIHRDFFGQDVPAGFPAKEQNSAARKEQWKGPNNTLAGQVDMVSNPPAMWIPPGQPTQSRTELYDPEEPTAEPKLNCRAGISAFGSSCTAGFGGFPPLHGSEETLSSGVRTLQPYQVNDYYDVTPTQLPHQCSICDKKVYNLKVSGVSALFAPSQASAGRVVHICNLPEGSCTENDVINLGLPFGKVTNYILMRSTHQAFLEMAYDEAAQAMVQYYQLTPAMINNQKLLIRMSKRYKELQLKKPGKDVLTVIKDITSQREREEMQELDFMLERPRSRSPINHSPPSHSPSFASCGSAHSPPAALDNRERPPRGSPQGFSSYRSLEDHFYSEQMYKSEKCLRPSYPRHDMKTKRRDGGDYHVRYRHPDFNLAEEPPCRPAEGSPGRRSKRSSRRQESAEKHEKETENNVSDVLTAQKSVLLGMKSVFFQESGSKEKSISPQENTKTKEEDGDESGEDTDEECWFPTNMEELVTVDEVGGEDDSIIEPDLPEVEGFASCPKETGVEASVEKPPAPPSLEPQEILTQKPEQENSGEETGVQTEACLRVSEFDGSPSCSHLVEMEVPASSAAQDKAEMGQWMTVVGDSSFVHSSHKPSVHLQWCRILFFIVPSSGFYCKLCELFYTSESAAKTTHCRSTVHYKNLQKYLSQLAEDSLSSVLN
uniref:RNA binding motif protein 20 n=1 Tax=Oryzias latipes TaxID=8090 RepID=A0A3B3IKA7_ORYLA